MDIGILHDNLMKEKRSKMLCKCSSYKSDISINEN